MKSPNLPTQQPAGRGRRRSGSIPAFLPGNLDRDCLRLQQNGVAVPALFKGSVHVCACMYVRARAPHSSKVV